MSSSLTFKRSTRTLIVALLLLLPSVVWQATVKAVPVTFTFEAEIDSIAVGIPFDSGVEFSLGDILFGRFSFEPEEADGSSLLEVVQAHPATLIINDNAFVTPASISDFTIRSLNDSGVADFPAANFIDSLVIGGSLSAADPLALPNVAPDRSSFRMTLWGDTSVLERATFPSDPAVWNSFQFRRSITLSIRGQQGGAVGFRASVGTLEKIPEPSTAVVIVFFVGLFVSARGIRFFDSLAWRRSVCPMEEQPAQEIYPGKLPFVMRNLSREDY